MADPDFPDGDRAEWAAKAREALANGESVTGKLLLALGTPIASWELECMWCDAMFVVEADADQEAGVRFCPSCGFGPPEKRWDKRTTEADEQKPECVTCRHRHDPHDALHGYATCDDCPRGECHAPRTAGGGKHVN